MKIPLDFSKFVDQINPEFQLTANDRHRRNARIYSTLEAVALGMIPRLIVLAPPRSGKTTLVSRLFPAYLLAQNADAWSVGATYDQRLSNHTRKCIQRIIESNEYQRIKPLTLSRLGDEFFSIDDDRGHYRGLSVGKASSILFGWGENKGKYISGVGIIDDPFKSQMEAESKEHRDKVWSWYQENFRHRQDGDAAIVIVETQMHEDDLANSWEAPRSIRFG